MKKAKAGRVPVLEKTYEVSLPKLMRAAKATGSSRLVLADGDDRTVAVLSETRVAVMLGGRAWMADIVAVPCLKDRARPLLKCPRAHEGNFQSLYFRAGELACRHCHELRYRTALAAGPTVRARLARHKLVERMGGNLGEAVPGRQPRAWRRRYSRSVARLAALTTVHYSELTNRLKRNANKPPVSQ